MDEPGLMRLLQDQGVPYERFDHAAVYTCEQSAALLPGIPGAGTKNLFLTESKSGRFFLLMVEDHKRVNFKTLGKVLGLGKLSFAAPEAMMKYLGLEPGSVTIFGLVNDHSRKVEVLIDRDLWDCEKIHCHPLVNTATLVVPVAGIQRFLELSRHDVKLVDIPVVS